MHSTKKVSNEEFKNLIKRISQLQNDADGISAEEIAAVFSNDPELLRSYVEYNFEEKKRKRKKGFIINAVLLGLAVPLSLFGGYKAREAAARFSSLNPEQDALVTKLDSQSKELESLEAENAKLNQMVQDKDDRIGELISQIGTQPKPIDPVGGQITGTTGDDQVNAPASSGSKTGSHPKSAKEVGANTPSGSTLQAGQTWAQDGIVMTLTDPSVKPGCEKGLVQFNLTLSNFSGKDQIVKFSGDDLAIDVDNAFSSNYRWTYNAAARNNCNMYDTSDPKVAKTRLISYKYLGIEDLSDGETVELYLTFFGDLESYEQNIKFHLENAGPIEKAKWVINPIPGSSS